ncbi:MAG: hypothetical protein CVU09_09610 [Bacteroidetes bacterium HGW-Bacteroidetes-4]|jgi:hypothetical protein|nr:MAG: hypothetical protein CVU09_09610 [Bacteroidetes bacterium HGW-Bacteroidetes-4]
MADQIQIRYDTAENWTAVNPVLAIAEEGHELVTNKRKIGDGVTAWNALPYFGGENGPSTANIIHGATAKETLADADELALVDSEDGNSLKKLSIANLNAIFLAWLKTFFTSRKTIEVSVAAGQLQFDFDSLREVWATKTGGGAIVVNENVTISYVNATNFKSLWFPVNVTTSARTFTFPGDHICGDERWISPLLTLEVGKYQISVMNDGVNKHVSCSQKEV